MPHVFPPGEPRPVEERIVGQREERPLPPDLAEWLRELDEVPVGIEHRRIALPPLPAASPVETADALRERDRPHVVNTTAEVMCWCRPFRHGTSWIHIDPRVPMGHGIIVPLEGGYPMGGKPNPGTKKDKRLKVNKKKKR